MIEESTNVVNISGSDIALLLVLIGLLIIIQAIPVKKDEDDNGW